MPVVTQIQVRRGTAAQWTSANPTLANGEWGYETDTNKAKIGNGSTAWNSLSYIITGANGTVTSITAGTGLTGGTITGTGTVALSTPVSVANGGTGITSFGSGVATWLGTPSSANLAAAVTDETGSGALVFGTSPTISTPAINNVRNGYTTTATAAGTTTLTNTSNFLQFFTGTTTQTVQLPDTTTMTLGQGFEIHNNSTGTVTVVTSASTTVTTISAAQSALITNILTSGTTAASWDVDFNGGSTRTGTGALTYATSPTLITPVITQGTTTPSFSANAYTLADADAGQLLLTSNGATAGTVNIPTDATRNFATGTQITILQTGSGQITIAAATPGTTTLLSTGATAAQPKCRVQYSAITIIKTAANTWYAVGDLS